jgi:hypothetical protein
MVASKWGRVEAVKMLVAAGVDMDKHDRVSEFVRMRVHGITEQHIFD